MATVLPALISINMKFLPTVRAFETINSFPLHPVKVAIPPCSAAFITAKPLFLSPGYLPDLFPTVFTTGDFSGKICMCLGWDHGIRSISPAK